MKKLLLLPLALCFSLVAAGQTKPVVTPVPADQIEAAGKPFIGTWNGISCAEQPIGATGVRFKFEQINPTEAPSATLLQTFFGGKLELVGQPWRFEAFTVREGHNLLFISNDALLVSITVYRDKIVGIANVLHSETTMPLIFAPAGDTKLEDFVKTNANLCTDPSARRKFFGIPEPTK